MTIRKRFFCDVPELMAVACHGIGVFFMRQSVLYCL